MRTTPPGRWILAAFLTAACAAPTAAAPAARSTLPVLLVHGMAWDVQQDDLTWGQAVSDRTGKTRWDGMVGYLHRQGLTYGGTIRARHGRIELPADLDTRGAVGAPREARLFVLRFTHAANTDGLALKALELAEAIRQVRQLTGCPKVRLVAHSAGGLVARVYMQGALPGVAYRGDVDRLVTIATPHLGSTLAEHFGDYLGTRATSIKPSAHLIRELNCELELPDDALYAAIVVRGLGIDVNDDADDYDHLIDPAILALLADDYRLGDDEVVHVRSQNLRLAQAAARYERRTGRAVQYLAVRVPDPAPDDWWPPRARIHTGAAADPTVQALVACLLADRSPAWPQRGETLSAEWLQFQARLHAVDALEARIGTKHPLSSIEKLEIAALEPVKREGDQWQYTFAGRAWSDNWLVPYRQRWTYAEGTLDLTVDRFGRVVRADNVIARCEDR